ncbi:hypothetical protein DFH06DRAFT_1331711 [Mycena polygramma]|nr:hypothetical protein DFH06DRAFT_1331711 [Mycena polygramma]
MSPTTTTTATTTRTSEGPYTLTATPLPSSTSQATSYTSGDTPTSTSTSGTPTPTTTTTTAMSPLSSARVRFDAECVLIPDLGLGAGSKRPRMVTKSYSLPLWRKPGHSASEEEDAHAHVVLKVALPSARFGGIAKYFSVGSGPALRQRWGYRPWRSLLISSADARTRLSAQMHVTPGLTPRRNLGVMGNLPLYVSDLWG